MELHTCLFQSIVLVRALLSCERFFGGKVDKNGDVGGIVFNGVGVDFFDKIHAKSARVGLVGKGRIDVAVIDK